MACHSCEKHSCFWFFSQNLCQNSLRNSIDLLDFSVDWRTILVMPVYKDSILEHHRWSWRCRIIMHFLANHEMQWKKSMNKEELPHKASSVKKERKGLGIKWKYILVDITSKYTLRHHTIKRWPWDGAVKMPTHLFIKCVMQPNEGSLRQQTTSTDYEYRLPLENKAGKKKTSILKSLRILCIANSRRKKWKAWEQLINLTNTTHESLIMRSRKKEV